MKVVKLTKTGVPRVLSGKAGMTFVVDKFTNDVNNNPTVAHVLDFRFDNNGKPQTWSLSLLMGDYESVEHEVRGPDERKPTQRLRNYFGYVAVEKAAN